MLVDTAGYICFGVTYYELNITAAVCFICSDRNISKQEHYVCCEKVEEERYYNSKIGFVY